MRSSTEKTETRNLREREHEQRGVTLKKCGPEPASRNPLGGERLRKPPDAVRSGVAKTSYSSRALGLGERSAMALGVGGASNSSKFARDGGDEALARGEEFV